MKCSKIISIGSYLPSQVVTNIDLAKTINTSDAWISSRTGIKQRHIADPKELTSDLAAHALKNALRKGEIDKNSIDAIIVATTTPDSIFPSTAAYVQKKAGLKNCFAFDINAVCSGFVYAYTVANSLIVAGQARRIALVGADIMSRILDWNDRKTCVLFGDGAGAIILEGQQEGTGVIASDLGCDGSLTNILDAGIEDGKARIHMEGKEVYRHAIEKMTQTVITLCQKANIAISDIDWLVAHQANIRILESVGSRLGIDEERVVTTVDRHANTSAASIPLALDVIDSEGKLKHGQKLVIMAAGAGFTWGGSILEF